MAKKYYEYKKRKRDKKKETRTQVGKVQALSRKAS